MQRWHAPVDGEPSSVPRSATLTCVEAVEAVLACGGAARSERLYRATTQRRLATAVRQGLLRRPAPGLYAVPDCPPAVLAAAAVRGVRSCHSAADALGLPLVGAPARPHVTASRGTRLAWGAAVVHRRDVTDLDGLTDPLTTLLDCLRCLPPRTGLVPVDAALSRGLVAPDELDDALRHLNRNDPRRRLVGWADPRAGSPLESIARHDLLAAGWAPRTQELLAPAGHVDFLLGDWLVVEVDGRRFHDDPVTFEEDRRRDAELTRRGFVVLRFTWRTVLNSPDHVLRVVAETFARGRPGARAS